MDLLDDADMKGCVPLGGQRHGEARESTIAELEDRFTKLQKLEFLTNRILPDQSLAHK